MTSTCIDLLRHGEAVGGRCLRGARTDAPLTEAGWQALWQASGDSRPWAWIATSPLLRCHAFAQALAARTGARLAVDARLREYDFGDWDGCSLDGLWREQGGALAAFLGDPDSTTPPGGETAPAFRGRVHEAWAQWAGQGDGEAGLIVSHGGVLRELVGRALGLSGAHGALEWPPAARSRLRLHAQPPRAALVFHAWTGSEP